MLKSLIRISCLVVVLLALTVDPTISKVNMSAEAPVVSAIQTIVPQKQVMADTIVAKEDDRAQILAAYFASKNSPFVSVAGDFVAIADKYDISWTLLPSISGVESSFGLHVPGGSFNPYGWNNGKYQFQSWSNATETVAFGLRTRYAPTGDVTPYRIGKMYAASPTWTVRVAAYQKEIERFAAQ